MNPKEHFWHQYFTDCCYPNLTLPFCELVSQRGFELELVSILSLLAEILTGPGIREKNAFSIRYNVVRNGPVGLWMKIHLNPKAGIWALLSEVYYRSREMRIKIHLNK